MRQLPSQLTHEMKDVVEACEAVYFPNLTLSTASKISFLDGDSAASLLGIFALMRGKPVIAARDSMFGVRGDYPQPPAGFRKRVEKILNNLGENGVLLVDIAALAQTPLGSPGSSYSQRLIAGGGAVASTGISNPQVTPVGNPGVGTPLSSAPVDGPCVGIPTTATAADSALR